MAVTWQCCPLLVLGVLALHVCTVYGNYEHTCTLATRSRGAHRNGICGDSLSRVISLLCRTSGYVGKWFNKRAAPTKPDGDTLDQSLRGILLNKKEALSYLHKRETRGARRGRSYGSQGISCECCYNPCTYTELLQYCN